MDDGEDEELHRLEYNSDAYAEEPADLGIGFEMLAIALNEDERTAGHLYGDILADASTKPAGASLLLAGLVCSATRILREYAESLDRDPLELLQEVSLRWQRERDGDDVDQAARAWVEAGERSRQLFAELSPGESTAEAMQRLSDAIDEERRLGGVYIRLLRGDA